MTVRETGGVFAPIIRAACPYRQIPAITPGIAALYRTKIKTIGAMVAPAEGRVVLYRILAVPYRNDVR